MSSPLAEALEATLLVTSALETLGVRHLVGGCYLEETCELLGVGDLLRRAREESK
jgi:hypothetical protein